MKNLFINSLLILIIIFSISCSKKEDSAATPTPGTFVLDNTAFVQTVGIDNSDTVFFATKGKFNTLAVGAKSNVGAKSLVYFIFNGLAKPSSGNYEISTDTSSTAFANFQNTSNKVIIITLDSISPASQLLFAVPQPGSAKTYANVTLNATGKLNISVPQITIKGTNLDNTDPKNTKSTDKLTTISGSFIEK